MDKGTILRSLVETYGYYALLAGTFIEGETILLIGGLVAHLGYLDLPVVMLVAFIGSFSGDQLYFCIGRLKGRELLSRYHHWEKRVDKVHCLMARYHDLIMVGFRFVYGIRILTPIVLGMNNEVKTGRFLVFNAIGAVIWSVSIALAGYFFGYALEKLIRAVKHYEIAVLFAIAGIATVFWIARHLRRKRL
ncbi:MAG: DedA family protein [Nitrospirae bacterium]|nr:DedA family protein [Nitrospirota bacterium]